MTPTQQLDEARGALPTVVRLLVVGVLALLVTTRWCAAQTVVYVNDDAQPGGNGQSWGSAFRDLQQALDAALAIPEASRDVEVWIAAGTYRPTRQKFPGVARSECFEVPSRTKLYGGFAGSEAERARAQPWNNLTILSGDLLDNDVPDFGNRCDNVFVVMRTLNAENIVLDGLVVEGGHNWNAGSPCGFQSGYCGTYGAAMRLMSSQVRVQRCWLRDNFTAARGTIDLDSQACSGDAATRVTEAVISNCVFSGNRGKNGVTVSSTAIATLVIEHCTATENNSDDGGAAGSNSLFYFDRGNIVFRNNLIWNNVTQNEVSRLGGGGLNFVGQYNCTSQGLPGTGNITTNPLLQPSTSQTPFRLGAGSPARNAGQPDTPNLPASDFFGQRRLQGSSVDMGASESGGAVYTPVLYVDADATGTNDGSTWANAFSGTLGLQAALGYAAQFPGSYTQIWVAAGVYKPSRPVTQGGSREDSFRMQSGLSLYGGFAGGETAVEQRDIAANETILSGDLNGDDVGDVNRGENALNVILATDVSNSLLSGCTVTGGNSRESNSRFAGAGVFIENAEIQMQDTRVVNNAAQFGGGMCARGFFVLIVHNSIFENNNAQSGGAFFVQDASSSSVLAVDTSVFQRNSATSNGGAINLSVNSGTTKLENVSFINNSAPFAGALVLGTRSVSPPVVITGSRFLANRATGTTSQAAAAIEASGGDGQLILSNSVFVGNETLGGASALLISQNQAATIVNCTFAANRGYNLGESIPGAAITIRNAVGNCGCSLIKIVNSLLFSNTVAFFPPSFTSQLATIGPVQLDLSYSSIDGWSPAIGGNGNTSSHPLFVRNPSPGPDQTWGTLDDDYGDLRLQSGSPAIDSGDTFALPQDVTDVDGDGNVTETLPLDLAGNPRLYDDPARPNTGSGLPPVDRGAYENNLVTLRWSAGSGRWNDAANWDSGDPSAVCGPAGSAYWSVPTSAARVVIDDRACSAANVVTFASDASAYSLEIPDQDVTFNMRTSQGSGNLRLFALSDSAESASVVMGRGTTPARLTITNTGTVFRSVIGTSGVLGETIGSSATLRVRGLRSGLELPAGLEVGSAGAGIFQVFERATAEVGSLRLGVSAGSAGSLSVTGQAGLQSTLFYGNAGSDEVVLGGAGGATVIVSDGGVLAAGDFVDRVVLAQESTSSASVTLRGDGSLWASAQDQLIVGDRGSAVLTITDGAQLITSTDNQIVLGKEPGSSALVSLSDGARWTEDVQNVVVGGRGVSELSLSDGGTLQLAQGLVINPRGTLATRGEGEGLVDGDVTNVGTMRLAEGTGTLRIAGDYRQLPALNDTDPARARRSGRLEMDVAGTGSGEFDRVVIEGGASLAGGLTLRFAAGFVPNSDLSLRVIDAEQGLSGGFEVALVPALPPVQAGGLPRFVRVTTDDIEGGVDISIGEVLRPYSPDAPPGDAFDGRPIAAAVADFDGVNGPDLAIAVAGPTPTSDGQVLVFRNAGVSGDEWLGYDQVTAIAVGPEPVDLVAADMDGVLGDDLVVATRGDSRVRVLVNDGTGTQFSGLQTITTLSPPTTVAAAVLFDGPGADLPDVVIGEDRVDDNISFLRSSDLPTSPVLTPAVPARTTTPRRPRIIRPTVTDSDKRSNLLVLGGASGAGQACDVTIIRSDVAAPVTAWQQFTVPVGDDARGIALGDLDGDGAADAVTANAGPGGAGVTIVLNRTLGAGPASLAPGVTVPIAGSGTLAVALGDWDGDAPQEPGTTFQDLDVAVIAGAGASAAVYTLRNDSVPGGTVTLASPTLQPRADDEAAPLLLVAANVDEAISTSDDIVSLGEGSGVVPLNNLQARRAAPGLVCDDIDFNNDGSFFDPQDIAAFFSVYSEGACVPEENACADIDFNNDGSLFDPCDIDSFLTLYAEGPCTPCGH